MKGIWTLLLLVSGFTGSAQTVSISVNGNRTLQLAVDSRTFQVDNQNLNHPSRNIVLTNLPAGEHTLQLWRLQDNNMNDDAPGAGRNDLPQLRTSTSFHVRPGFDVAIVIAANGVVQVREKQIAGTTSDPEMTRAMPADAFQILLRDINFHWRNTRRITAAQTALRNNNNYFSTEQVYQILETVSGDENRLTLARLAYGRVTDPANFTQVYPLMGTNEARDQLNGIIRTSPGTQTYSSFSENFRQPMSDLNFDLAIAGIRQLDPALRLNAITTIVDNETNYFTVAQVRKMIEEVAFESARLQLLKQVFTHITDVAHYPLLYSLLTTDAARIDLINHVRSAAENGGLPNFNRGKPAMAEDDLEAIFLASLNIESNILTEQLSQRFANIGNYFTAQQAAKLISLTSGELTRLSLAKSAYRGIINPEDYLASLNPLLGTVAARNELSIHVYSYRPQ